MQSKRFVFLAGALLFMTSLLAHAQTRQRINFDADWRFHLGPVTGSEVDKGYLIPKWRYLDLGKVKPADETPTGLGDIKSTEWKDAENGQDAFNNQVGWAWFRADLPEVSGPLARGPQAEGQDLGVPGPGAKPQKGSGPQRVLWFQAIDDNGTIYLNGKKLLYHQGWNDSFEVNLNKAWKEGGPNQLAILVENTWGAGYIKETYLRTVGQVEKTPPVAQNDFNDASWRSLHLPHDFVVEGTFDPKGDVSHGFLPKNVGWYRKTFDVPASAKGKSLWIDFDGVYRDSRVWLNGKLLGHHLSGYTGSRYDITGAINYGGKNTLTVYVDATGSEGWWYEGGGIYRHVWLTIADPLHVAPWGTYAVAKPKGHLSPGPQAGRQALVVPSQSADGNGVTQGGSVQDADLALETTVDNQTGAPASFNLVSEVRDAKGKKILSLSTPCKLAKDSQKAFTQKGKIAKAVLWSLENPHLYTWTVRIEKGRQALDQVETKFGVRSFHFDADKGFFLNGKPVKIQGTCNHQDFAGVGVALSDRLFTYRLEKLKEMGCNAYRCSHNPPAPELLDECDRLGIMVMDENRRLGDSDEVLSQVDSMVRRDRNHPSILWWSLCNEEPLQGTPEGKKRGTTMKKVILGLDKTRIITCAMNYGWAPGGLSDIVDAEGFNYAIDQYEPYHAAHPKTPLYGSETASTVSTRGIYESDRTLGYVSAYDVNHTEWAYTAEAAWRPLADRPWMAGGFVWTGFDYRGEPTPYAWPCVNSHFGILDMCGFPKDNFYYYQAWWSGKPVLHLFPHWNWQGKDSRPIPVWVDTNYDLVELFLNGKSLGKQETPKYGHLEWQVWYAPGTLTAKAYNKGVYLAETSVETTSAPASIRLKPYVTELKADGEDTTPVAVEILDEKGRLVQVADNEVAFSVTGACRIAGVANGDPSSHEPDKTEKRKAFNGLCMVLVQTNDKAPGKITLTATSPGLQSASVDLQSLAP